jgi:hypothetical protein
MKTRKHAGSSLIESVFGIMIFVPILLLIFVSVEIFCAEEFNARVCRDAVRKAAMIAPQSNERDGSLSQKSLLYKTAHDVVQRSSVANPSIFSNVELSDVSLEGLTRESGEYLQERVSGNVRVKTSITVKLPASLGNVLPSNICLSNSYSYPLTAANCMQQNSTDVVQIPEAHLPKILVKNY